MRRALAASSVSLPPLRLVVLPLNGRAHDDCARCAVVQCGAYY